jgi:hypothetical protein
MSEDVTRHCDNRLMVKQRYKTCGKRIQSDKPTVFSIDETAYAADLCDDCKLLLREAVDAFIRIARPEYRQVGPAVRRALRDIHGGITVADVRKWCQENGIEVSQTGRIKQSVEDAYKEAHGLTQ